MHLTEYQRLIYMWSTNAFFIMPFVSFKYSKVDAMSRCQTFIEQYIASHEQYHLTLDTNNLFVSQYDV